MECSNKHIDSDNDRNELENDHENGADGVRHVDEAGREPSTSVVASWTVQDPEQASCQGRPTSQVRG